MDTAWGPAVSGEGIGGSPCRCTTLLERLSIFGKPQLKECEEPSMAPLGTHPAADPEAALDGLAVEHVVSGSDESACSSSLSTLASEPSTQPMAHVRSKEKVQFLKRVGRTDKAESQLDMDCSLAVYDQELLRAVPASAILSCAGRAVMSSSQGSEATFSMSRSVTCMHFFVSHSWETPAWMKMVCLLYEMNAGRAVVAAVATQIGIGGLQIAGLWNFNIFPECKYYFPDGQYIEELVVDSHCVLSCFVFFVVLLWGQAIRLRESLWFLDKCCINQTDSTKKTAGIKQLGAFLRNSEYLIVLWQPEYFTRLWCIYELAAFSHINRSSCNRVLIRPLKLSVFTVALSVWYTCALMAFMLLAPRTLYSKQHDEWMVRNMPGEEQQILYQCSAYVCMGFFGIWLLPGLFFWRFCKWHVHDLRTLLRQLSEFRLADTKCEFAEDRIFVLGQIIRWFGSADEFESYVKDVLHSQVEEILKDQGPIPFGTVLVGSLPHFLFCIALLVAACRHDGTEYMWRAALYCGIHFFCGDIIIVRMFMRLAETSIGEDIEGKSFFERKLAGPLLAATIASFVGAASQAIMVPSVPLWTGAVLFVGAAGATVRCNRRKW